jgi:hypothetical protein
VEVRVLFPHPFESAMIVDRAAQAALSSLAFLSLLRAYPLQFAAFPLHAFLAVLDEALGKLLDIERLSINPVFCTTTLLALIFLFNLIVVINRVIFELHLGYLNASTLRLHQHLNSAFCLLQFQLAGVREMHSLFEEADRFFERQIPAFQPLHYCFERR